MSGRMGALKTAGRGWVDPEALPSPPRMPTVGLPDILLVRELNDVECIKISFDAEVD